MTFEDYEIQAMKTNNHDLDWYENVQHSIFMLSSEVGEIAGPFQKFFFQGHDVPNHDEMVKEMGDVLWALNKLAYMLGSSLDEVAEANIEKLRLRYGEKFSEERSVNREI